MILREKNYIIMTIMMIMGVFEGVMVPYMLRMGEKNQNIVYYTELMYGV